MGAIFSRQPAGAKTMTPFRTPLALALLALLSLSLGGCLFDHPLTEYSSTNLDTRLLGVFEFKEAEKPKPNQPPTPPGVDNSIIHRMAVLPLSANRYMIYYRDFSKKPAKVDKFIGWISRVDTNYYISFQDITEGSGTTTPRIPTLNPFQLSSVRLVQESEVNVPVNSITPCGSPEPSTS